MQFYGLFSLLVYNFNKQRANMRSQLICPQQTATMTSLSVNITD